MTTHYVTHSPTPYFGKLGYRCSRYVLHWLLERLTGLLACNPPSAVWFFLPSRNVSIAFVICPPTVLYDYFICHEEAATEFDTHLTCIKVFTLTSSGVFKTIQGTQSRTLPTKLPDKHRRAGYRLQCSYRAAVTEPEQPVTITCPRRQRRVSTCDGQMTH